MGRPDDLGQYAAELERLHKVDRERDEQQARERERQEQFERAMALYVAERLPSEPMSDAERRAVTATLEDEARERLAGGMPDGCQRGSRFSLVAFRAERAALLDRLDALEGEVRPLRALARARRARRTDGQAPSQDDTEERAPRIAPEDEGASLATLKERIAELETEAKGLRPLAAGHRPAPTVGGASAPHTPPRARPDSSRRATPASRSRSAGGGSGRGVTRRQADVPRPTTPPGAMQRAEARELVSGPQAWAPVPGLEDLPGDHQRIYWDMERLEQGDPVDEGALRAAGWREDAVEILRYPYRYELRNLYGYDNQWSVGPDHRTLGRAGTVGTPEPRSWVSDGVPRSHPDSSDGRRSGSGAFESGEHFKRIMQEAVRAIRNGGGNPTQPAVVKWLKDNCRKRSHLPQASVRTLKYWAKECGYPRPYWKHLLAELQ